MSGSSKSFLIRDLLGDVLKTGELISSQQNNENISRDSLEDTRDTTNNSNEESTQEQCKQEHDDENRDYEEAKSSVYRQSLSISTKIEAGKSI